MPAKKISQLNSLQGSGIERTDLLTIVDTSEQDTSLQNKSITIGGLCDYIKNYTSFFPIILDEQFVVTDAVVNGNIKKVSTKIQEKTVKLNEVDSFLFDKYGRIYDYIPTLNIIPEKTSIVEDQINQDTISPFVYQPELFYASGSAASWFKGVGSNNFPRGEVNIPGSNNIGLGEGNAGFFNSQTYFYPLSDVAPMLINYSDKQTNDENWSYLFNKSFKNFDVSEVNIIYGGVSTNDINISRNSEINLFVNWKEGYVIGGGLISSTYYSYPVTFSGTRLNNSKNLELQGIYNTSQANYNLFAPKLSIDFTNKKFNYLPMAQIKYNGYYPNLNMNISLSIRSQ